MWILLAALACKEPVQDTGSSLVDDTPLSMEDGDLADVSASLSGVVPTVVRVSWTSPVQGDGFVEYGTDSGLGLATPVQSTGTQHEALVLGLKANHDYFLRAVTVAADGSRYESGVGQAQLPVPPDTVGRFELTVDEGSARPDGYVLTSLLQTSDSWMIILDRDGDIVWYYPATDGYSIPTTLPGRDGRSLLFTQNSIDQDEDISNILRISVDGTETTTTRAVLGHHSFVELPEQRFAWLSLDMRTVTVDGVDEYLAGDTVLEIQEGATDDDSPTEVFNYFDDWGAPTRMCNHFDAEAFTTGAKDWTHGNSLMYVESQDDLYLMAKNYDHVLRIDRSTGSLVEQIGGPASDYSGPEAAWWSHGHMSQLWEGGMVVFDNGYHHEPTVSRVLAYSWDEDAGTIGADFQYTDPDGQFIQILGDGRLLDNGNVLSAWTSLGLIKEHSPDGTVVWQVSSELGTAVGRVTMLDDLYTLTRGELH